MAVYINKVRRHDQDTQARRFSVERAEWYESLRRSFLKFCDKLPNDSPHLRDFHSLDQFRAEGLRVIDEALDFWRAKAAQGADDPFVDYRAAISTAIDPNMTMESFQEMVRPMSTVFGPRG